MHSKVTETLPLSVGKLASYLVFSPTFPTYSKLIPFQKYFAHKFTPFLPSKKKTSISISVQHNWDTNSS